MSVPGHARRTYAAMNHLKEIFGSSPPPLVIMLQEVTSESLAAILAHLWVRDNFLLSNVVAPQKIPYTYDGLSTGSAQDLVPRAFFK